MISNWIIGPLARLILRLLGWQLSGSFDATPRCVVVVQHTSNWDGILGVLAALGLEVWPHWLGKKELFKGPQGILMRKMGGIPVDRSSRQNLVEQVARRFEEEDEFILGVTPEGTRGKSDYWRSGFYHIAMAAGVPIVQGIFDYKNKRIGVGEVLIPAGDIEADIETIRAFFEKNCYPKKPENAAPIRLKPEI